jgi:uncharacterized membrane protein
MTFTNSLLSIVLLFSYKFSTLPAYFLQGDDAVVRAVLFYSPNCGHCHLVITETLPPLFEKYGNQLDMIGIDVTQPAGQALFLAVLQHFNLESGGVPFLVIGDTFLVGSVDIPEKFPGLIDQYLAQGGVDWPSIPGLAEAMAPAQPAETTSPIVSTPTSPAAIVAASPKPLAPNPTPTTGLLITSAHASSLGANFAHDPLGNSLAVFVLAEMIFTLGAAVVFFFRQPAGNHTLGRSARWNWLIPVLCLVGLGVAGYLAFVETTQAEAVCGPVGDCNAVQQSAYARLFGILPIGILGLVGYVLILLAWIIERFSNERLAGYASLAQLGLTTFGLLFTIYLTFLEPFVIGATCAWCLASAILMSMLFGLSLSAGKAAFIQLLK